MDTKKTMRKKTLRELTSQELDSVAGGVQETRYFNGGGHEKDPDSPSVKTSQHFAGPEDDLHPTGHPREA